jgi:hypothetical protein
MTLEQWESEIDEALEGSDWVGSLPGLMNDSATSYFTATRQSDSEDRYITISRDFFYTPALRLQEIRRHLGL